jgi:hypothetical protein
MIERGALFSDDGKYRFKLWRNWNGADRRNRLLWVMLNPSTAGGHDDDPTIRKCIGFSKRSNFDGLVVVNCYAYCATKPADLWKKRARSSKRMENDVVIADAMTGVDHVVLAAGTANTQAHRAIMAMRLEHITRLALNARPTPRIYTLGRTEHGLPKHPLYVPYAQHFEPVHPEHSMEGVRGLGIEAGTPKVPPRQLILGGDS